LTRPAPSRRPSVNARPALVVVRASKPSPARIRAVPASHGFGITKAPARACSARKRSPFSSWVTGIAPSSSRDAPQEGAVLAHDTSRALHPREGRDTRGVLREGLPVPLVGRQVRERDERQRLIGPAGVARGQEVADEVAATAAD